MFFINKEHMNFNFNNSFCISLETSMERWNKIQQRFQIMDLQVSKWKAYTPDTIFDNFAGYLNPGQKSCSQSHISIWRHIVEKQLDYALVLEDDACFDLLWMDKLNSFQPPQDWHMIVLNCSEPIQPVFSWECIREQYLTGGYVLSLQGAKQLLQMFSGYFHASDWMTVKLQEYGKSYSYFPWLIIQEGNETTIGSGVDADHQKVLRCLGEINYDLNNYII